MIIHHYLADNSFWEQCEVISTAPTNWQIVMRDWNLFVKGRSSQESMEFSRKQDSHCFQITAHLRFSSPAPPNLLPCPCEESSHDLVLETAPYIWWHIYTCLVEGEKGLSRRMRRLDKSPQTWYSRLLLSARIASSATCVCLKQSVLQKTEWLKRKVFAK